MLGSHAKAYQTRGYSPQHWKPFEDLEKPGRDYWLRTTQHPTENVVLHEYLASLSQPRRQFPTPLHSLQMTRRDPTFRERLAQNICCGYRILNRKIDSNATNRRHGVRG